MKPDNTGCESARAKNAETSRAAYIRLLTDRCVAADVAKERDAVLCGELIDGGYLDGGKLTDMQGQTRAATLIGITVQGRLFLQELKEQEHAHSWLGRAKRSGGFIGGFLLGVVAQMLPDLIKSIWIRP